MKLGVGRSVGGGKQVAPFVGAWIETPYLDKKPLKIWSHPSWVRGLKHASKLHEPVELLSHPSWVRGLKLHRYELNVTSRSVAPFVGAWIETESL